MTTHGHKRTAKHVICAASIGTKLPSGTIVNFKCSYARESTTGITITAYLFRDYTPDGAKNAEISSTVGS